MNCAAPETQPVLDTFSAIEERRAVKHYDPEHQLTETELNRLIDLALLSPTSFNTQNWRFVHVKNPELRQQIRAAAWDQAQVTEASALFILCGDLKAYAKDPARYWRNAPDAARERLVPMIGQFYDGNESLQRDEVLRSVGIAAQTMMLAAKAMGYDSCPMIGFDQAKVAEIIKLPANYAIGMMLVVGKAVSPANPRGGAIPREEAYIVDHFTG